MLFIHRSSDSYRSVGGLSTFYPLTFSLFIRNFAESFILMIRILLFLFVLGVAVACSSKKDEQKPEVDPLELGYTIRSVWPHDTEAFTQGLVIHNGELYESTGQNGTSWIGVVDINSGKADKKVVLDTKYFGEGITILNNKVYQLTYKHNVGFVYALNDFKKLRDFMYDPTIKEGWGLTHDHTNLIMSDGTDRLFFLDTVSLQVIRTLKVSDAVGPVTNLNELEYIDGHVFANVWNTNNIVKIDPATGKITGRLDLTQLANDVRKTHPKVDVLNGIAWHESTNSMLVTGKHWPFVYILKIGK